jgi:class 3 adenylate cyclase
MTPSSTTTFPTGWRSWQDLDGAVLFSRVMFALTVLAFSSITVFCTITAILWVNKPFPGFLFNARQVVADFGLYHWSGVQAGLRYPDKLISANNRPIVTDADLEDLIQSVPVGTEITYEFDRHGERIRVTLPTMRLTAWDLAMTFGIELVTALLFFSLGTAVFLMKPDTELSWAFFLACSWLGVYVVFGFDVVAVHKLIWVYLITTAFLPATFAHMSLVFPYRWGFIQKRPGLVCLPYLVSAIAFVPLRVDYPGPVFLAVQDALYVYFFLSASAPVVASVFAYLQGASTLAKQRAKFVLFGAAVAFPIPALLYVTPLLGGSFGNFTIPPNFIVLVTLIFPSFIAYAISKHNLFDVDVYIKRTVGYALMTAVVGLSYFFVQTVVGTVVLKPVFGAQAESVYPIIFALLVVFFFNPVNRKVQEGIEKLFFRKSYDYKATVASIGDTLASLVDLDAIITKVIYTIREQLFLDKAVVILLDPARRACQALVTEDAPSSAQEAKPSLCLSYDDPLLVLLEREKKLITKYDIAEEPRYAAVRESCGKAFSDLGASLAMPLMHQNTFAGALTLGYKKSGHFYSRDDIDLLKTISSMTATAIEQAREKEQRGTLMQLFSKHVSPQVAESLWQQRDQFLEGGRPRSQKLMATVMFTDLQGFTGVSEKLDPQALLDWLNTYMEAITSTVMEHGGVVDDYFGDGVKVNFGVPIPRATEAEIGRDAINAVMCALALEEEMRRLNTRMTERDFPTLRMRIGIFSGPVVAGSLGSADRMKFTTLGDTVNTASRLESYDKDLFLPHLGSSPCRILIGDSTFYYIHDHFETERIGEITLKGKEARIATYCVLGRRPTTTGEPITH